jgi:hypothetical protein
MTSASVDNSRGSISVGRIFARASATLASNPFVVLAIALLCGALPSNGLAHLIQPMIRPALLSGWSGVLVFYVVNVGLGTFLGVVSQAAMTRTVVAAAEGEGATLGKALWSGLSMIVPLFGLALLIALSVAAGTLLLVVPGVCLLVIWSVAASVLIEDDLGIIDALYRSAYLTKGARVRILGIELVLFALGLVATALITTISMTILRQLVAASHFGAVGRALSYMMPALVIHTLLYAFVPAVKAALYLELREWKDGPVTATLAEVFA